MLQKLLLLCAVITLVCSLQWNTNDLWTSYKAKYNKHYSYREDITRRAIWESNLDKIEAHNIAADRGEHTYWKGENQFTDMTRSEVNAYTGSLKLPNKKINHVKFVATPDAMIPDAVDWRKEDYVTEVKDQGNCGSCWASSATGSLEGQHFKKAGQLVSLSEQNLVDYSKDYGNDGCYGGIMDYAFLYIKENKGIDTEASYPYIGQDEDCRFDRKYVVANDTGFVDIESGSEAALQQAVAEIGPISIAICVSDNFSEYKHGVLVNDTCQNTRDTLGHALLVVGYGVENCQDYWLIKNSWGSKWGDAGYIKMARNRTNQCGVATLASYPTV